MGTVAPSTTNTSTRATQTAHLSSSFTLSIFLLFLPSRVDSQHRTEEALQAGYSCDVLCWFHRLGSKKVSKQPEGVKDV